MAGLFQGANMPPQNAKIVSRRPGGFQLEKVNSVLFLSEINLNLAKNLAKGALVAFLAGLIK
jgi:hypothetical protein